MVKNKLSSRQFKHVHVKLVRKRPSTHHKTKIVPWDNNINHPKVYPENMSYTSTWLTATKSTNFSNSNSSLQQDKNTSQNKELHFNSIINQSKICSSFNENIVSSNRKRMKWRYKRGLNQSSRINVTWTSALKFLSISVLGLFVTTALILPNVLLYLMLPVIFQTPANQTTNVTEPLKYANHCGNVLPYTKWNNDVASVAIYMVVDTTNCSFNSTPLYYSSIIANNTNSDFTGNNAIYGPSRTVFYVYIRSYAGWTSGQLLNYAQTEKWNLTWIGIPL